MVFCCILQYFVAKSVFLQFTLFCREICFCNIYALLRGEKFSQKLCPWRKNYKYEVWVSSLKSHSVSQNSKEAVSDADKGTELPGQLKTI